MKKSRIIEKFKREFSNIYNIPRLILPISVSHKNNFHYFPDIPDILYMNINSIKKYNKNHNNKNFIINDGTKVIGYIVKGYFFDLKQVYEPGFNGIK